MEKPRMTPMTSRPWITLGPRLVLAGLCTFWFSETIADPDLWGHIRFGQDILNKSALTHTDTYSYRTAGQPWINHEWLSEVIFATIYDGAGTPGLVAFKVLVSLAIIGLADAHLRRCGLACWYSVVLLMLICVPFQLGMGTVRPQIFTYILFLTELLLLARAETGRESCLWALPILFAVWVNLHGGVLAGLGVASVWMLMRGAAILRVPDAATRNRLVDLGRLGLLGMTCGLALLLNPFGAGLVRFLLRTGTVPRPEITEWTPLGLASLPGVLYLGLVAIGLIGVLGSRRPRRPAPLLIFALTAALPMLANRHYPLFALAMVVLGGEHIGDTANRWLPSGSSSAAASGRYLAVNLAVSAVLIGLAVPRFGCIRIEPFYFGFPARAVALLKQSRIQGNMAVPFDWGEYVIWHLGPAVQVSIDGRRETVYSDERYQQSHDFARGNAAWDRLLTTGPPTDLVLLPNGSPVVAFLSRTPGWLPLYQDSFCVIFAREGFPDLDRIVRTPVPVLPDNGDRLCFPAPADGRAETKKGNGRKAT
jgi:hypothetical protein